MRFITTKIAGMVIRIGVSFYYTENLFKDFLCEDENPQFTIFCTQEDYNRAGVQYEKTYHLEPPSDVYLEEYVLFEKIYDQFTDYGIFTLHGAAIAVENQAYIFSAPSKTGKTTHVNKWIETIENSFFINGDKPFILTGSNPMVCGSPWAGKERQYTNSMVPLKAIIFMERSEENHIVQTTIKEAFPLLIQQTFRPDSAERLRKTLIMLKSIEHKVSFYHFQCNNFKEDCFHVAYSSLVS